MTRTKAATTGSHFQQETPRHQRGESQHGSGMAVLGYQQQKKPAPETRPCLPGLAWPGSICRPHGPALPLSGRAGASKAADWAMGRVIRRATGRWEQLMTLVATRSRLAVVGGEEGDRGPTFWSRPSSVWAALSFAGRQVGPHGRRVRCSASRTLDGPWILVASTTLYLTLFGRIARYPLGRIAGVVEIVVCPAALDRWAAMQTMQRLLFPTHRFFLLRLKRSLSDLRS